MRAIRYSHVYSNFLEENTSNKAILNVFSDSQYSINTITMDVSVEKNDWKKKMVKYLKT